jgi:imidazole glycerol-phosphate synthase subunit HisF
VNELLKLRVMPTILYNGCELVKGVSFDSWRCIGSVMQSVKVYNMREVDELVFLDIRATLEKKKPDFKMIDDIADECFMPLTVGGGISTVDDVKKLFDVGADKIAINSIAHKNPQIVHDIAEKFGSQCVVVSIDVRKSADGKDQVFTHAGTQPTGQDPLVFAQAMEQMGAGEILLTSINRDGTMQGYDLDLIKKVSSAINIPVIASGGAGSYVDMLLAIKHGGASAIAAASMFHFTQQTPREAKKFLHENGISVRI